MFAKTRHRTRHSILLALSATLTAIIMLSVTTACEILRFPLDERILQWSRFIELDDAETDNDDEIELSIWKAAAAADRIRASSAAISAFPCYSDARRDLLFSPMFHAARLGHINVVAALREWGAPWEGNPPVPILPSRFTDQVMTALEIAVLFDRGDLMAYLLSPVEQGGLPGGFSERTLNVLSASLHMTSCFEHLNPWICYVCAKEPNIAVRFVYCMVKRPLDWLEEPIDVRGTLNEMLHLVPRKNPHASAMLGFIGDCLSVPGKIPLMQVLWEWLEGCMSSLDEIRTSLMRLFIRTNYVVGIQRLRQGNLPVPWPEDACTIAASNGHLALLKELCTTHRCSFDKNHTVCAAARAGHVDVIFYLQDTCPPSKLLTDVLHAIFTHGHVHVLDAVVHQWHVPADQIRQCLKAVRINESNVSMMHHIIHTYKNVPNVSSLDEQSVRRLAEALVPPDGDPEKLNRYLLAGGKWFTGITQLAIKHNAMDIFKQSLTSGGPRDDEVWSYIIAYGRKDMLDWMLNVIRMPTPSHLAVTCVRTWNMDAHTAHEFTDPSASDDTIVQCFERVIEGHVRRELQQPDPRKHADADLNLLKWARWAILTGRVHVLKWLWTHFLFFDCMSSKDKDQLGLFAAENGQLECVMFMRRVGVEVGSFPMMEAAVRSKSMYMLNYMCNTVTTDQWEQLLKLALTQAASECFVYIHHNMKPSCLDTVYPKNATVLLDISVRTRQLWMADYIRKNMMDPHTPTPPPTLSESTAPTTTETETVTEVPDGTALLMTRLRSEWNCGWENMLCALAAAEGDLPRLQWLRSIQCPWDEVTCMAAAEQGHLHVLQWAHTHGCPLTARTYVAAVHGGQLHVLQYLNAQDTPIAPVFIASIPTEAQNMCLEYVDQHTRVVCNRDDKVKHVWA